MLRKTRCRIKGAFRGYTGYHNPPNTQAERFFVEREYWGTLLPQNMKGLAEKMDALASQILLLALGASGIPQEHWHDNGPDSQVLKYEGGKLHVVHPNFKEFVDQKFATAYATQAK